jgi:hypothetical protein
MVRQYLRDQEARCYEEGNNGSWNTNSEANLERMVALLIAAEQLNVGLSKR